MSDPQGRVDLRSDTVTRPTQAMRDAMMTAEVGDDVFGEDPTIVRLQDQVADLFGRDAALFVPSGTMANQIALAVHTRPGDAVIIGEGAHSYLFESGGPGLIAGILFNVAGTGGPFTVEDFERACSPHDYHFPPTTLVAYENTHNRGGGAVFPDSDMAAVSAAARQRSMAIHLDGARLFNAVAASGVGPARWAEHVDSVSFCLSKGLGAPVGSLIVGDADFIAKAHRYRKMLGGGMRQAGILAAAGLYALEHNVDRLADDHARTNRIYQAITAEMPSLAVDVPPQTNILYFRTCGFDAASFVAGCEEVGVRTIALGPDVVRIVTHLEVTDADVDRSLAVFRDVSGRLG